jgi:hypothetical protein
MLRWQNNLEEYSSTFKYIPGPDNVIADTFSCLPRVPPSMGEVILGPSQNVDSHYFSFHFDDDGLLDCFLNHPPLEEMQFLLDYTIIKHVQFEDK